LQRVQTDYRACNRWRHCCMASCALTRRMASSLLASRGRHQGSSRLRTRCWT